MKIFITVSITFLSLISFLITTANADIPIGPIVKNGCAYIDCDCENLDFGLLTGPYREECRAAEKKIKEDCASGIPAERLSCNTIACGPDAWPVPAKTKPTLDEQVDKVLKDLCKKLGDEPDVDPRLSSIRRIRGLEAEYPPIGVVTRAAMSRISSETASFELQYGLARIDSTQIPTKNNSELAIADLVRAQAHMGEGAPLSPEYHAQMNRIVEILANAGIFIKDLVGGETEVLEFLKTAQEWDKAGLSADELRQRHIESGKQFVTDIADLLPAELAPWNGPVLVAFRDSLAWTDHMFEESTNGLNLVAKAIETGKFDDQAYQKVANHLQSLAANGPWGASTARDSIKKWAEGVPLLGNLVKALFDDPIENDPFGPNGYCRKYP